MKKPTILLTARDPATAYAFKTLISSALEDGRFEIQVIAQSPAYEVFSNVFSDQLKVLEQFTPVASQKEMTAQARDIYQRLNPDIVLTGISGPDIGVDEAMLCAATSNSAGPYALQSYWGDLNESLNGRPGTVFVLDAYAANLTKQRVTVNTLVVGSIKHEGYEYLDIDQLQSNFRNAVDVGGTNLVLTFCGQPLQEVRGYYETIEKFSDALGDMLNSDAIVVYRPHPKEPSRMRDWTKQKLGAVKARFLVNEESSIEEVLAGSDIVVSAFSTCGYDLQQLIRVSKKPLAVPLYLMFNPELASWYKQYTGLESIPMCTGSMAIDVRNYDELPASLARVQKAEIRQHCFEEVHERMLTPEKSSLRILNHLYSDWSRDQKSSK